MIPFWTQEETELEVFGGAESIPQQWEEEAPTSLFALEIDRLSASGTEGNDRPNEGTDIVDESITIPSDRSLQTASCPFTAWPNTVMLELVVPAASCYSQLSISHTPTLAADLEKAYLETYAKVQAKLCDPYVRKLTSAKIVALGTRNALGIIPIELRINGTCRGCNGLNLIAYDLPTGNSTLSQNRRLQSGSTTCTCPIVSTPTIARAPFEAEFVDEYQKAVMNLHAACPVTVAECDYGTGFSTGIYMKLESDIDLTDADVVTVGQAFKDAVNIEYMVTTSSCNPDFREVQNVIAKVMPPPNATRRVMQKESSGRHLQKRVMRGATVNLYTTGTCNHCKDKLISTDKIGRRRLRTDRRKPL